MHPSPAMTKLAEENRMSDNLTTAGGMSLLRVALKLDAVVTGGNGLAYVTLAGPLDELLGLSPALLRGAGAFLLVFAALVWLAGSRDEIPRAARCGDRRGQHGLGARLGRCRGGRLGFPGGGRDGLDRPAGAGGRRLRGVAVGWLAARVAHRARGSFRRMKEVVHGPRAGALLREWRQRRRLSQMDLALEAGVSTRHLSFVETGRSRPSSEMVLHLAEQLEVPLRDRNQILLAAGHAPAYGQRDLDDPVMGPAREALDRVLAAHDPYPALAVDRHWGMVAGNTAVGLLIEGVAEHLLAPPVNVLRVTLHPDGMAPRIANLSEWRAHLLERLGRQAIASGDPAIAALQEELGALPGGDPPRLALDWAAGEIAVPLRLRHPGGELSFISTVTTFGTALDITVAELAIESFFPANEATGRVLRDAAALRASAAPSG